MAEKHLSLKANRALFSLKQSINGKGLKPSAVLHIFDILINSIALYDSEILTAYKPCYRGKSSDDFSGLSFYYVLRPQEFSLSQVSDKVIIVIC